LPLLIIIPVVWSENSYSYYGGGSEGEAFWYSLLTLVIYMAIARLIKIAVLYVALGRKPEWKKEFKKLF
jgi:cytoskeletal protein RodZ